MDNIIPQMHNTDLDARKIDEAAYEIKELRMVILSLAEVVLTHEQLEMFKEKIKEKSKSL